MPVNAPEGWSQRQLEAAGLIAGALEEVSGAMTMLGAELGVSKQDYLASMRIFEQIGPISQMAESVAQDQSLMTPRELGLQVSTVIPGIKRQAQAIARISGEKARSLSVILFEARDILIAESAQLSGETDFEPRPAELASDDIIQLARERAIELKSLFQTKRGRSLILSDTLRVWLQWAGFLAMEQRVVRAQTGGRAQVFAVTPELVLQAMLAGWRSEDVRKAGGTEGAIPKDTYDALVALREYDLPQSGDLHRSATSAKDTLYRANRGARKMQPDALSKAELQVYLMPETVEILVAADRIRRRATPTVLRIDARHFAAACLIAAPSRRAFLALGGRGEEWHAFLKAIEAPTMGNTWHEEDPKEWADIFAEARELGPPVPERPAAGALLPRYSRDKPWIGPDGALLDDPLGVVADARAMADLIVLEEPGPPLAIGLFGDWGSGKSTFMEILEKAIGENTAKAKLAREQMEAGRVENRLPFVENIAHIRFNAWHYAEADLWASLAANIFRSLYDLSRKADRPAWMTPESFAALLRELELVGVETASGEAALKTAEDRVAQRRVALDDANHKRELWARAKRGDMRAAFGLLDHIEDVEALDGKLESLGLQPAMGDAAALVESVRKARTLAGRLGSAFRKAISWRGLALLSIGALLAALAIYGASWIGLNFGSSLGLVAPLLAGALPLLDGARRAHNILSGLSQSADELESAAKTKVREASNELLEAERERADAETALRLAERRRASLEALGDAENPQAALEAFIEARVGETGYHQNLGLISRLHDDFRSLSELLAASGRSGNDSAEPKHLQRIVLYIDDLDRCDDRTVLRVLEAVHLLLALPLFVVVVGVDARWLEGALERQYKKQLQAGDVRPEDYLEKIFQLPYWLRRMDPAEGGTFRPFLNSLLTPTEAGQADQDRRARGSEAPGGASQRDDKRPREDQEDGGERAEGASAADVYAEVEPLEEEQVEALREAVEITPAEVAAIEALGPLIAKSPRSAKRFMNLYRFEKARRMRENAEAFMGTDEMAAEYPAVMLALAMDIGISQRPLSAVWAILGTVLGGSETGADDAGEVERRRKFAGALHSAAGALSGLAVVNKALLQTRRRLPEKYVWTDDVLAYPPEDEAFLSVLHGVILDFWEAQGGSSRYFMTGLARMTTDGDLPRASFRRPEN